MDGVSLRAAAQRHMRQLCVDIPNRRVGSDGNRLATEYFASIARGAGFEVTVDDFDCVDWATQGVTLSAGNDRFEAFASPYSLGCDVHANLVTASSLEELSASEAAGAVLLLRDDLAKEQVMPRNFPFYNPEHHQALISALERLSPAAIAAATTRDPVMVGSQYPFPVFEDGDFDIPSVYMTDVQGERLAAHAGENVFLASRAQRIASTGQHVTARTGAVKEPRVVLLAHIDTRMGTPGANDNASGTAVLLVLAEMLAGYDGRLGVEMIAVNGEDYYGANGELLFVAANEGRWGEILLGINLDDVAYRKGRSMISFYGCPQELADTVRLAFSPFQTVAEGPQWFQGDHMILAANQVPALAVTDECYQELMAGITHTPADTIEIIDPAKISALAHGLFDLIQVLDGYSA